MINKWLMLVVFVGICLLVGFIGGYSTRHAIETWYAGLTKPSWNPPNWVFGPVWTILYILMGIAAWYVWRAPQSPARSLALWIFGIQLFLNFIWTPLFFGMHAVGWAAVDIVFLWLGISGFIFASWRVNPTAAVLFIPYWAWVTYASTLNIAIWRLNR
jgi:tryptophan-rich sensory protein